MSDITETKLSDVVKRNYEKLFQDGKLVNLHVRMWGMAYQLELKDLHLENIPKIFQLGKKYLIKDAVRLKFKGIEGQARNCLYSNSIPYNVIPGAHFVPKRKYVDLRIKLQDYQVKFNELVEDFITNYETYKEELLQDYPEHRESLEPFYPAAATMRDKFSFSVYAMEMTFPSELKELDLHEAIARDANTEEERLKINTMLQADYKKHQESLESFVYEAAVTLRTQVTDACHAALEKIKKKEIVNETTFKGLLEKIKDYKSLNFLGDKGFESEVDKLQRIAESSDGVSGSDLDQVKNEITEFIRRGENTSDVYAVTGEYFRAIKGL